MDAHVENEIFIIEEPEHQSLAGHLWREAATLREHGEFGIADIFEKQATKIEDALEIGRTIVVESEESYQIGEKAVVESSTLLDSSSIVSLTPDEAVDIVYYNDHGLFLDGTHDESIGLQSPLAEEDFDPYNTDTESLVILNACSTEIETDHFFIPLTHVVGQMNGGK